jgi:hypothetical protein
VNVDAVIEATAPRAQLTDPGQSTTLSVSLVNRLPDSVTTTIAPQAPNGHVGVADVGDQGAALLRRAKSTQNRAG